MEDPLDVDLGVHRWLKDGREEAYSDWLELVIRQILEKLGPKQVFELFGFGAAEAILECDEWEFQREYCVPYGHTDQEGRLDLVIRFGDKAIIVVEVKKGDAEDADTDKHRGYNLCIEEENYSHIYGCCWLLPPKQKTTKALLFVRGRGLHRDAAAGNRHLQGAV